MNKVLNTKKILLILFLGFLLGVFFRALQAYPSLSLDLVEIDLTNNSEILQIMESNTNLFFEKYEENYFSNFFRLFNKNQKHTYQLDPVSNGNDFLKISLGEYLLYIPAEVYNER